MVLTRRPQLGKEKALYEAVAVQWHAGLAAKGAQKPARVVEPRVRVGRAQAVVAVEVPGQRRRHPLRPVAERLAGVVTPPADPEV